MKVKQLARLKLVRDTGWSFLLKATGMGLGFLVSVFLARTLGASGYGIYSYAFALVMLLAIPAQAGIPHLLMRETARNVALDKPEFVRGVWTWAGRSIAILSIAFLVVGGAIVVLASGGMDTQTWTFMWAFLLVPLIALGAVRGAALRGLDQIVAGQLPEFILRPAALFLLLGGVSLLVGPISPPEAMGLHVLAAAFAFAVGAFLLWRHTPESIRRAQPRFESKTWLRSALPLALTVGMASITGYADVIMLGFFEPPDQVGIYRVSVQLALLASFGLRAVNLVVAPRFARLYAEGDMQRLQELVTASARVVLAVGLAVTIFFVILGRPALRFVFGAEFVASYLPLVILLAGHLVNSAAGSVGYLLNMTDHERDEARVVTVAAAVNIVLNLVLIPILGTLGAATSTTASLIVWRVWLWRLVRRRLGIDSLAFRLGRGDSTT